MDDSVSLILIPIVRVAYIESHYDDGTCSPETAQGNLTIGPPATAPAQ